MLHSQITGSGTPLLILHGFLGMADNWRTLALKYAESGFEVHMIDQRNHGHSFHSDDFSYALMADDLAAYVQAHSLEKFVLMGHSMGGKTAMLYATQHPEHVEALIVADIAPKFYPVHHQDILKGLASINFDEITSRSQADKQLSHYVGELGVRQFLLKNLYWQTRERLGFRLHLKSLTDNVGEIGEALPMTAVFEGKTLFLKGEYSEYVMPDDEALIKTHFPQAEIQIVPKAGHWLHAQNPDDFFEKTISFIHS
ncbi:MAG: alpha/beta fold hydrolase [Capnocytophaga sp.]|nr:alpha/beta fold hydrolase [Capnocytophaga sp.]